MAHALQRTISMENIANTVEPSAPLYRNPARDDQIDDLTSVMDRMSMGNSGHYEIGNNTQPILGNTPPNLPQRNKNRFLTKPNKVVVHIKIYDGINNKESIEEWFKLYELMAITNNWDETIKKNQLYFTLGGEPARYCLQLQNGSQNTISYAELKSKISDRFTNKYNSSTNFYDLTQRKFTKGENFQTYWSDKMELMQKADPEMTEKSQINHIICGLEPELYSDVLKFNHMKPPDNLDDLYQTINNLNEIERSAKAQKALIPKTVRFDERNNPRRNFNNGRTIFPRNDYFTPRNDNSVNIRSNYQQRGNNNFNPGYSNPNQRNEFRNYQSGYQRNDYRNSQNGYQRNDNRNNSNSNQRNGFQNNSFGNQRNGYQNNPNGNQRSNYQNNGNNNQRSDYRNNGNSRGNNPRNNNGSTNGGSNRPLENNNGEENSENQGMPQKPVYSRTPDGIPICYVCRKPGHTSYTCPEKENKNPGN